MEPFLTKLKKNYFQNVRLGKANEILYFEQEINDNNNLEKKIINLYLFISKFMHYWKRSDRGQLWVRQG